MESASRRMEARGVGDKAAADLLGGLKAVSELIELLCQVGQFVLPRRLKAVAVLPLAHHPDGPKQRPDAGGEHPGKERAHRQGDHRQQQGDGAQVLLKVHQQGPLGLVPVADINGADGHVAVHDGGGGGGEEGALLVGRVKDVIALKGQHHLLKEGILVLRGGRLLRRLLSLLLLLLGQAVVQQQAGGVGDQNTLQPHAVQPVHHPGHLVGGEGLQLHEGGGHHGRLAAQGVLLGGNQQVLGGQKRVGVQQHQHQGQDGQIAHGIFDLEAGEKRDLLLFLLCAQGTSPFWRASVIWMERRRRGGC